MLNGVLWPIPNTKRIHLLCKIPTRDLCEPRKTSKRKLSYRFWKESWYIYFSGLKQSPSVVFQQYSPFLLLQDWQGWLMGWERRTGEPGPREDRHTQGPCRMAFIFCFALHVNRCAQMKAMRNQTYCSPLGAAGEHWAIKCYAAEDQSVPKEISCCRGCALLYSRKENRPGKV